MFLVRLLSVLLLEVRLARAIESIESESIESGAEAPQPWGNSGIRGRDYSSLLPFSLASSAWTSSGLLSLFFMNGTINPVVVKQSRTASKTIDSINHSQRCRVGNWAKPPLEPSGLRWGFRGIIPVALAVQVKQEPCQWSFVLTFFGFSNG